MRTTIAFLAVLPLLVSTLVADEPPEVTVVSFNIRYGSARDGENRWDQRRDALVERIRDLDPDLLGTQETLEFQRDFLAEKLTGYEVGGVGRDDGKRAGEMMAVYWRTARFEKLEVGHFWLSETPDVPGSKSWDSSLPRMATWVKLRDRRAEDAPSVLFVNTHFDHRGPEARRESAALIRERITSLGKGCSVILTGDFNAAEGSDPYSALLADRDGTPSPLVDAYRIAHPERRTDEGTFSGFRTRPVEGGRIDWITCTRDWKVQRAEIDREGREGRYPSDHFAVRALLSR